VKCYISEKSLLARLAAWRLKQDKMAMVMGRTILLHNTTAAEFMANKKWLRHELAHIRQFQQYGYIGFLYRYFIESIKNGYYNNKYEREAREAESDMIIEHQFTIAGFN
jgi:hypothetical protein